MSRFPPWTISLNSLPWNSYPFWLHLDNIQCLLHSKSWFQLLAWQSSSTISFSRLLVVRLQLRALSILVQNTPVVLADAILWFCTWGTFQPSALKPTCEGVDLYRRNPAFNLWYLRKSRWRSEYRIQPQILRGCTVQVPLDQEGDRTQNRTRSHTQHQGCRHGEELKRCYRTEWTSKNQNPPQSLKARPSGTPNQVIQFPDSSLSALYQSQPLIQRRGPRLKAHWYMR